MAVTFEELSQGLDKAVAELEAKHGEGQAKPAGEGKAVPSTEATAKATVEKAGEEAVVEEAATVSRRRSSRMLLDTLKSLQKSLAQTPPGDASAATAATTDAATAYRMQRIAGALDKIGSEGLVKQLPELAVTVGAFELMQRYLNEHLEDIKKGFTTYTEGFVASSTKGAVKTQDSKETEKTKTWQELYTEATRKNLTIGYTR